MRHARPSLLALAAAALLGWAAAPAIPQTPRPESELAVVPAAPAPPEQPPLSLPFLGMYRLTQEIEDQIAQHSARYGVDPELARAICMYESGGNENLTSQAGARGYFQVMPATFKRLGVQTNIEGGIKYFSQMMQMFGREDLALAAYNGGPGTVQRHRPLRMETLQYVLGIGYYKNILREHGARVRAEASQLEIERTVEGDTWWTLSRRTGVPMLLLRMYNPFLAPRPLRAGLTVAYPPGGAALALEGTLDEVSYVARPGDHYLTIAFVFGIDLDEFRRANGLWHTDLLLPGTRVRLPLLRSVPYEQFPIQPGEDLAQVAARAGVSEWDLVRDNGIWDQSLAGLQSLRSAQVPRPPAFALYTVRRGDTLSSIAERHRVSVSALRSANGLSETGSQIRAGQILKIPVG